jgi:hypothetical protein
VAERLGELKVRSQGDCRPDRAWLVFLLLKDGKDARNNPEKERKTALFCLHLCNNILYGISKELLWRQERREEIYMMLIIIAQSFSMLPLFVALGLCCAHVLSKVLKKRKCKIK